MSHAHFFTFANKFWYPKVTTSRKQRTPDVTIPANKDLLKTPLKISTPESNDPPKNNEPLENNSFAPSPPPPPTLPPSPPRDFSDD